MDDPAPPRDYPDWRESPSGRAEDAAYLFGYYLIRHCRDEALATLPAGAPAEARDAVGRAVDTALHNVCDLLEGLFPLRAGRGYSAALVLGVRVLDARGEVVETRDVSPNKLDLPAGYWDWALRREFRAPEPIDE